MMGRPEPCVLYAHTFVHPQLDEYVDEVLFPEPVVITACEFLEQNSSSICPAVKLVGATSPPSFALEVFIQCEGDTRFRRLCLPLLYSQSSSNVLEVEAVVTNHLVIRGSYRSLSMVIYGNTAEDLGQFNIEVDIDSSLSNTVSTIEGNLEDLPPAFHPSILKMKELVSPLKIISRSVVLFELPLELRKFLGLTFRILDSSNIEVIVDKVTSSLLSVASTFGSPSPSYKTITTKQPGLDIVLSDGNANHILAECGKELLDLLVKLQNQYRDSCVDSSAETFLEPETDAPTIMELMNTLHHHFDFSSSTLGYSHLSQTKNIILWLSVARLLCSARESCFHFVSYGGMDHLGSFFTHQMRNSTSLQLLLLGVIDQATQHSIGCEGFLGWWPREDEIPPACISYGYNQVLKVLLESRRHDIASFAAHILHRVRFYEVACRYECTVLSILDDLSTSDRVMNSTSDILTTAKLQLKKLSNLLKLRGQIDDPSPSGTASRYAVLGDSGQLAYKTTIGLINQSNSRFLNGDIDRHLLSLLKERGFLPLSVALLSSSVLRSEAGNSVDLFVDVVLQIEAILIMLLFCPSGLEFLLHEHEVFSTIVDALRGIGDVQKEDCFSVRYASVLLSKGFFCSPQEVGLIMEMHMNALVAVDRLCKLTPNTEEFLWVLWDLCRLSRTECGRQAMLILENFPEALKVLITALHSGRDPDPASLNTGVSPLNLAIFHSTAEIFEVVVNDSTATSLKSWIDHANELHLALHSSSHGSNKKDAPARLLEWIDAGVVYQRNGAIGLLQYAAVLVSGGELHMAANSVLASDMMDEDYLVGDSSCGSDGNVVDNLIGKRITGKDFPGVTLRDSSIAQLTTALRILAFISDNSVAAAALYDEGAVMVVHAIIINCKLMLEKSSNIYDFLVDEGTECSSTSDLLLERNREKCLFDLLIPSLLLLINLLQTLKESKEQHRNTNLMNAMLQLHREVSPKLAASAADLSHSCPDLALGIGAVCHLLASALACWPIYCWTPSLFQFLLDNLHANSLLALGPKDSCSLFCLLNDLLPDEGIWRWKSGIPILNPLRAISVGTLLGPEKEKQINWHLEPGNTEKLLSQLSSKLEKLGEIILHCAVSMSVVLQDILRVFVIRIACLNADHAAVLVKPILSWVSHRLSEPSTLSDTDTYKVSQLLKFLSLLLEHPNAKPFFLKEGGVEMLTKVLERCIEAANYDVKLYQGNITLANSEVLLLNWCNFVFLSISSIGDGRTSFQHYVVRNRNPLDCLTAEDCYAFLSYILRFFNVLPMGIQLFYCISSFKEMVSSIEGQSALHSIVKDIQSSAIEDSQTKIKHENYANGSTNHASEWNEHPPLLSCWTTLFKSIDSVDALAVQVTAAIDTLASSTLGFCVNGESVNMERLAAIKLLLGLKDDTNLEDFVKENLENIEELTCFLGPQIGSGASTDKIMESAKLLLLLLQQSSEKEVDPVIASSSTSLLATPVSSRICKIADKSMEQTENLSLDIFGETFFWECPENLGNRPTQTGVSVKRKIPSLEGTSRNARGENAAGESTSHGSFLRGSVPISTPAGPTRRDAFRQRKPNTSRPPSMHVDDYVARERNADGINSSNVITVPRMGSSSGRPPSIHVDVFMARHNERQTAGLAVNDTAGQVKPTAPDENLYTEKSSESRQLRPDLDDDLQGIEIVFDAEESSGPDDRLHFPQSDDNLQLPPSVPIGPLSPHSIVEETGSDVNGNMDENTMSEYSSKTVASYPEMQLTREPSISSYKKFPDQSQDARRFPSRTRNAIDPSSRNSGSVATPIYMNTSASLLYPVDSRLPPNFYSEATIQQGGTVSRGTGLQGFLDQKIPSNQPPLPPMPPPPTILPVTSQNRDPAGSQSLSFVKSVVDLQPQVPSGFHVQSEYASSSTPFAASVSSSDLKYGRSALSSSFASNRPALQPTPLYSSNPLLKNHTSQSAQFIQPASNSDVLKTGVIPSIDGAGNLSTSRSMVSSYPLQQTSPQPVRFRPGSLPISLHGANVVSHHGDFPIVSQSPPISVPLVQPIQTLTQLQPLQPPLIPRPPPSHLRPSVPASQQSDQRVSLLHGSVQVPAQSSQLLQQPQASPAHVCYETQQPENLSLSLPPQQADSSHRASRLPGEVIPQQQDSGTSLHDYFRSPEAIQYLLSDREKLCQLLQDNPKLLEMLQADKTVLIVDKL